VVPDWEDPETTMTGEEYIKHLKDLGYDKAKIKKYLDILITFEDDGEETLAVVQASPQSVTQFELYKALTNKKIKAGKLSLDAAAHINIKAKKTKLGKFNFTKLLFSTAK
jgi:DNA-binding transcriptional MerR regulator